MRRLTMPALPLEVTFTGLECLLQSADYELLVHEPDPRSTAWPTMPRGQQLRFCGRRRAISGAVYTWRLSRPLPVCHRRGRERHCLRERRLARSRINDQRNWLRSFRGRLHLH